MDIHKKLDEDFEGQYVQRKIAYLLLKYGLSIRDEKIHCGPIEQSNSKLARAISIDYRVVNDTIKKIKKDQELFDFFSEIEPTPNLKKSASIAGWGVIEIVPVDPQMPGILHGVSKVLADSDISIKQAIVEDYDLTEDAKLIIVTQSQIPINLIDEIKRVKGIRAITLY